MLRWYTGRMSPAPRSEDSIGPVVGVIIVVLVLALGGAYMFYTEQQRVNDEAATQTVS